MEADRKAYYRDYYARNRERLRKYRRDWARKWYQANREKALARMRKSLGYPDPTRPPPAICEICGMAPGRRPLCLDHDHVTGKFRGWLCDACNVGLGSFRDNVAFLKRAISYLRGNHDN